MKHISLTLLAVSLSAALFAAPTKDYYSTLNGKTGSNLKSALTGVISQHTNVGYDGLFKVYAKADVHPDGTIWDMYSLCTFAQSNYNCSYKNVCDCYNREHSLPKSWWGGGKQTQYSDAYHVVPTDGKVNNQRSNYAFGECANGTKLDKNALGRLGSSTFSGYSGTVFEPDDEYKGDFARNYLYMIIAYPNVNFTSGNGSAMFAGPGELTAYGLNLLLKWHRQDPVSQKELDRNDAVSSFQGNRNPFIDYPCLVEYIWGNNKNEVLHIDDLMSAYDPQYMLSDQTGCYSQPTTPTIISPETGTTIEIGAASINQTVSQNLSISATLLNSPINLSISGTNATYFSLSTTTIPAATANKGTTIAVNYTPKTLGVHTATLTISSNGANTITATLKGDCSASIISPKDNIYLTNNNVGETMHQQIEIKTTNLASDLQLLIGGANANMYALDKGTISAEEANNGTTITLLYTPRAVGNHKATLNLKATGVEKNISIDGNCVFTLLPATNITYNSAQLNWSNAGTQNYTVNVYQKSVQGIEEKLIFSDDCQQTKGTTSGYTSVEKGGLRLGSGSTIGTLSFSNINISAGGRIEFEAMYYNKDDCGVEIKLGNSVLEVQQLTNELATYSINVEPNNAYESATLMFSSTEKSKRVIISKVNVYTGGETEMQIPIDGFPQKVGNIQLLVVNNLDSLTEYYFTVQPDGQQVSEEMMFVTDNSQTTAFSSQIYDGITYRLTDLGIEITRIPQGADIYVYDAQGRTLISRQNTNAVERLTLAHGFYLIRIGNETIKIVK